jgi:hypothetical protein
MASSDFQSVLSAAEQKLIDAGYACEYWQPVGGWSALDGEEAAEDPYPLQRLAALQIFAFFFIGAEDPVSAWVHLAAEMQAGKTGVMQALYRLILWNSAKTCIPARNIFNITGMSDNAWTKQIKDRLAEDLHRGVSHGGGLPKIEARLKSLAGGGALKNVLIIVDESHLASSSTNRPCRHIYDMVAELCPTDQWAAQNIRFLTISATDPAKAVTISGSSISAKLVVLETDELYLSVEALKAAGRLRECGNLHRDDAALNELKELIAEKFPEPRYHLVRPRYRAHAAVMERLQAAFPEARVVAWDSQSKPEKPSSDGSTTEPMEDINELLAVEPEKHTFILLKNMFYAAKSMDDTYVGVLYDRAGGKDDTNLQSLLGRACGYGKSKETIVFTSGQTVSHYLDFWYAVIRQRPVPALTNIPYAKLDKKMAGQRVCPDGTLQTTATHAAPIGGALAAAGGGGGGRPVVAAPVREKANEDNFQSEWRRFATLELARAWSPKSKVPPTLDGFYLSSTTGSPRKLRTAELTAMEGGKKTANLPWKTLKVGGQCKRLYVGYSNEQDPATAVFSVRCLTRIK